MSTTADGSVKNSLAQLLEARLHRRQALQLMGGTAAVTTLMACGVSPAPTPMPVTRTNTVVLRGRVKNPPGQDRDRLQAIAAFFNPPNRSRVDILGEYWTVDKPIVHGKPGQAFLGKGMDMVVIARGESAAAVREWAAQWSEFLDIDSDEVEPVGPSQPTRGGSQGAGPTFLVFERRAGAVPPQKVLEAEAGEVTIVSHHVLVNGGNRQILVVRAPSREVVRRWVNLWGSRRSIEVLELTNLSTQLRAFPAVEPAPVAAAAIQGRIRAADYHPGGQYVVGDLRPGAWYLRHQATGRYLSVDSGGKVITVPTPSIGDRWITTPGSGLDGIDAGNYVLQHQGTLGYLRGDAQGNVSSTTTPQNWTSGLVGEQTYGVADPADGSVVAVLSADSNGAVTTVPPPQLDGPLTPTSNWEQWQDYNHPTQLELTIHNIVTTTAHDEPWPEDLYTGAMLSAYNDLVGRIGRAPKTGGVTDGNLDNALAAALKAVPSSEHAVYNDVIAHLRDVVSHLETLEAWYGDGGHVGILLHEITINNLHIINDNVQGKVPAPAGSSLKFALAEFFTLLSLGLAAAGAGPVVAALIAGVWRLYSSVNTGGNNLLSTTFSELRTELNKTFNALITQREDARSAMANNWGKLKTFAGLVNGDKLVWPQDTGAIRDSAARQFEISVWQTVAKAIWQYEGQGEWDEVDRKDRSADLSSSWDYLVQAPGRHLDCHKVRSGWFTDLISLSSRGFVPEAPESLAQYLFDDADGNLGISMTDFYMGRNGWAMQNVQSHTD